MFIASSAGISSLMRGAIGSILEAGGAPLAEQLLEECSAIAEANGHPLR
jgi:2-dehydropantoate 2-reductase